MSAVVAILGIILLLFGRTLFWLFVAGTGFLLGVEVASVLLPDQPEWLRFLAAIIAGVLGGVVGIVAQRLAFALGGFFAGGYAPRRPTNGGGGQRGMLANTRADRVVPACRR